MLEVKWVKSLFYVAEIRGDLLEFLTVFSFEFSGYFWSFIFNFPSKEKSWKSWKIPKKTLEFPSNLQPEDTTDLSPTNSQLENFISLCRLFFMSFVV